jgi:hypothetical protein
LLRLELEVPLWKRVSLRLAPEATLIVSVTDALRRAGTLDPWGFGIGGEGSLHARFSPRLSARLAYREARAYVSASATLSARLVDVERYVLLDALVRY